MQGSNSSIHSDFNVKNICIPKVTAAKLIVCTIHNSKIEGLLLLTSKKIWNPFFNDNVEISTEIQYTHLHNKYHCVTVYMNTYIIQERFVSFENYVLYSWNYIDYCVSFLFDILSDVSHHCCWPISPVSYSCTKFYKIHWSNDLNLHFTIKRVVIQRLKEISTKYIHSINKLHRLL